MATKRLENPTQYQVHPELEPDIPVPPNAVEVRIATRSVHYRRACGTAVRVTVKLRKKGERAWEPESLQVLDLVAKAEGIIKRCKKLHPHVYRPLFISGMPSALPKETENLSETNDDEDE